MDKKLIIENGKVPQLVGTWRIGEIRAAAQYLLEWIDMQSVGQMSVQSQPDDDKQGKP